MDYIYKGECNVPEQVSIDSIKLENWYETDKLILLFF